MNSKETRKYQVHNRDLGMVKVVTLTGAYGPDVAWRAAAAEHAGWPGIDPSYASENVIRIFPWWLQ